LHPASVDQEPSPVRRIPFASTGTLRLPHIDRPSTSIEISLQKSNLDSPHLSELPRQENLSFTIRVLLTAADCATRSNVLPPDSIHRRKAAKPVRASEKLHIAGLLHLRVM
jgi:hypothetical protein